MANSRASGTNYEYATVDSQPTGGAYYTNEVCVRDLIKKYKIKNFFFSIREFEADSSQASDTSNMTVSLQFKCPGDLGWQDYVPLGITAHNYFTAGNRFAMDECAADVFWRAGIKDNYYISGKITFGFDW